jgi:7-keto-8-aminopelargonate synthetase-like enzyme
MNKASDTWDLIDQVVTDGIRRGLFFQRVEDKCVDGRVITLKGRRLVTFGSCSYVGLETDPRIRDGVIDATTRYGSQFASARAYVSAPLYNELDELLEQLFGMPALTGQTTTLAHMSVLPVLIDEKDAVIFDQQVHHSVQMALDHVRVNGTHVEMIRHNQMEQLLERVETLRQSHRHVWYLGDGIYSMIGDVAPVDILQSMLERYEQLYVYLDDAHGISWTGKHGRGYVLGRKSQHPRMIVAASLCKAFAAGGAALLIPDKEMRRRVNTVGPTMIFSGPLQPPLLGAAIASARIHLSDELKERQAKVLERIRLCNALLLKHELPLLAETETPIRCIALGAPQAVFRVVERLAEEGFLVNAATFPAVPRGRAGIRLALTPHLTLDDVTSLIERLAEIIRRTLAEEGISSEGARANLRRGNIWGGRAVSNGYTLSHETSIISLDRAEWDSLLGARGVFSSDGLAFLENTFRDNPESHNNWKFHYFLVRDARRRPILATFFTDAIWKDDMLSSEALSRKVEERRREDPYYLASRVLSMGALLTEGEHLFLDRTADWRKAMLLMLEALGDEQLRCKATNLVIRDIAQQDHELDAFLKEQGFFRFNMPESFSLELDWPTEEAWLERLPFKARWHQKKHVLPFCDAYRLEVIDSSGRRLAREELEHCYELYLAVKKRSLTINTFALPDKTLECLLATPNCELLQLRLAEDPEGAPVAWGAALRGPEQYIWLVSGLDYRYVRERGAYRQLLYQIMRRAKQLGARRLMMGLGASGEKRSFGATGVARGFYVMSSDQFNSELLVQMRMESAMEAKAPGA